MKTVNFIFGIHNHQPVGNFDFVMEDAFQNSYLPFIEVVEEFPNLHISFHFSGCLLEWIEKNHPDYIKRIAKLVARGNVEIISGGFYEPVLAMIPERDRIGQIRMMNEYIKKNFNYDPKGLWLTERVWEPGLAKPIAEAGIEYVTVDDYHFLGAGKQQGELDGTYITEEQGLPLEIFPINQNLRYTIPFKDPQETIDYLGKFATDDGDSGIVMADDGEKFGVWPGTYDRIFKENWLRDFFRKLEENNSWLKTKTFSEYKQDHPPKGRIYLPTCSYFEMSEWSLPWQSGEVFANAVHEFEEKGRFEELKPFFKGGVWRNFLFRYDESNWMQKKAQNLSNRIAAINTSQLAAKNKIKLDTARKHLWRGTCNCAYWHGIFGGLYLPHLRQAIYSELISCERILDEIEKRKSFEVGIFDFDLDGQEEVIIKNENIHATFLPHKGAMIYELSLIDKSFNVLNTLKRYKESYHRKVIEAGEEQEEGTSIHDMVSSKEDGLENYLKYDPYPRKTLVDHFIKQDTALDNFCDGEYYEDSDFIEGKFDYKINKKTKTITFSREGWLNWHKFAVTKEIKFVKSSLLIKYNFHNLGNEENKFRFGPEFNFAMLGGNSPDRYYEAAGRELEEIFLASKAIDEEMKELSVVNEYDGIKLTVKTEKPTEFWRFPVETVSLSEAGFERVYQSSVIIPWYDITLKPDEKLTLSYQLLSENIK